MIVDLEGVFTELKLSLLWKINLQISCIENKIIFFDIIVSKSK